MLWQPIINEDDPYRAKMQRKFLDVVRRTYEQYKPPQNVTVEFIYNNEPISEKTFLDRVFKFIEVNDDYFEPIDLDTVGNKFAKGTLAFWYETLVREREDKLREFDNKSMYPLIDNLVKTNAKLLSTGKFGNRLPFCNQLKKQFNCTPTQLYEHIKDWRLGLRRTVTEWYTLYDERREQARRSIQIDKDSSKEQALNKKGIPKPPTKNKDKRPVHDKDVLAYPFKSKLKQYRKTVDANVPYVEPPEQPRIQYELLHRPYFSHEPGCWEIDHAFNVLEEGDKWMFCINVNTRYLVVYNIAEKVKDVWVSLMDLHARYKIKSIRGDGSNSYCLPEYRNRVMTPEMLQQEYESGKLTKDSGDDASTYTLMRWYMRNNITIYFNSSPFTLHNKIVDVAIKTIRNAIGYRRLKPKHMEQLVDYYNNTVHKSIGCTPAQMQDNPEIEYQYIRWCERKLTEIIANQKRLGYLDYKPGNILMVHIDKGKTSEKHEKRRRFFDKLGVFVKYDHGNVVVDMLVKGVRVHSTGLAKMRLTVPVYHTKFVSERVQTIPPEYKDYYINSMKVLEVDDIYNMPVSEYAAHPTGWAADEDKNNND